MSTPDEEARSLEEGFQFLLDLSSGAEKRVPSATRERARRLVRHYPQGAGPQWLGFSSRAESRPTAAGPGAELVRAAAEQVAEDHQWHGGYFCTCGHGLNSPIGFNRHLLGAFTALVNLLE
ncbi:hypothetical protein GON03_05560 [Nocardioides sp. MAH-18]|uniref:Uncharacterized protein n=1 Tax=Nocardioides agri TaxID=2682843 RepID=A0A6L6XNH3_9ACTN|nr:MULTISPECIES: BPSL0761 family protein [unclassified Nocardioides]MBA2953775.1 hypothetical protein [Nocardioides sp. CGMCC 1.13656]MVQ48640.1 hypothetical protein [Nocardioides sp. MAH-18]